MPVCVGKPGAKVTVNVVESLPAPTSTGAFTQWRRTELLLRTQRGGKTEFQPDPKMRVP